MFAKSDGPTALRAELVRALAFSEAKVERPGDEELVESVAALAAVWNGRKGYVALLVRDVEPPRIERYVTENQITSVEALAEATIEGAAFAESLGFAMDDHTFAELSEAERDARMHRWNKLRKLRKAPASRVTSAPPDLGDTAELIVPEPPRTPAGLDIDLDELSVPAPPPIPEIEMSAADIVDVPADPEADTSLLPPAQGSAVLGKISLVRRGGSDARRLEQIARLLAFFKVSGGKKMIKSHALVAAVVALVAVSGCTTLSDRELLLADQHRDLAQMKLAQGEAEAAVKEYRRALKINPYDPETHLGLAEAYRRKGMLSDAERELQETLRLDPTHQEARLALGVTYLQQERWVDAAAEFQTLVDDPSFLRPARALVNLGWAHYKSGDLDQAVAVLERALKVDRANYTAHLDLGIVLYDKGDLIEAIQHFEACVSIVSERPAPVFGPAEAEARFRMARAYVRLNQRERAVTALRVAVERGGESEWAQKSSDYLKVLQ